MSSRFTQMIAEFRGLNWVAALAIALGGFFFVCLLPQKLDGYAIAATVAVLIAFVAYPWQKGLDRDLKVREERRQTYRRFVEKANDARDYLALAKAKLSRVEGINLAELGTSFGDFSKALSVELALLQLCASEEVSLASTDLQKCFKEALEEMRHRLVRKEEVLGSELQRELVGTIDSALIDFDKLTLSLIALMKAEEF